MANRGSGLGSADSIVLRGLTAKANHGVYDYERRGTQPFVVDIVAHLSTRPAALTDALANSLNYGMLAAEAMEVLTGPPVALIETLAERIAERALRHDVVDWVEVTVHKPAAPIKYDFEDVAVTIRRTRNADGTLGQVGQDATWTGVNRDASGEAGVGTLDEVSGQPARYSALAGTDSRPPIAASRHSATATQTVSQSMNQTANWEGSNRAATRTENQSVIPVASRVKPMGQATYRHLVGRHTAKRVVLALGGNLDDVRVNLSQAVGALMKIPGFAIDQVSPLIRTKAVTLPGQALQPDYQNAVVLGRTVLEPEELLAHTQAIEAAFGRNRSERWGPRPVDIDLIDVDHQNYYSTNLQLPHPRAAGRAFVLVPWQMIAPDDTVQGRPIRDLAEVAADRDGILGIQRDWLLEPTEGSTGPVQVATIRGLQVRLPANDSDYVFRRLLQKEVTREAAKRAAAYADSLVEPREPDTQALQAARAQDNAFAAAQLGPAAGEPARSEYSALRPPRPKLSQVKSFSGRTKRGVGVPAQHSRAAHLLPPTIAKQTQSQPTGLQSVANTPSSIPVAPAAADTQNQSSERARKWIGNLRARVTAAVHRQENSPTQTRVLPDWRIASQDDDIRVFDSVEDEAADLLPAASVLSASTSPAESEYLPSPRPVFPEVEDREVVFEETDFADLDDPTALPAHKISRSTIVRPTPTGQIPINPDGSLPAA